MTGRSLGEGGDVGEAAKGPRGSDSGAAGMEMASAGLRCLTSR